MKEWKCSRRRYHDEMLCSPLDADCIGACEIPPTSTQQREVPIRVSLNSNAARFGWFARVRNLVTLNCVSGFGAPFRRLDDLGFELPQESRVLLFQRSGSVSEELHVRLACVFVICP